MNYKFKEKLFFFCLPLLLFGCGDYSKDLGGNYRFVRTNSDNHVIIKKLSEFDNEIKVHSNVQNYAYDDVYILGVRVQSKDKEAQYADAMSQGSGYFVLNKNTGEIMTGLSKSNFDQFVRKHGLSKLAGEIK
ncbi:hypothetical protein [uncultured Microbulbifer sp.]|uniref:hypothetical protein n=1 Tax=uncultured Microbulbifer sp. TaxID=348147 RepID=UPI0026071564|nr:hypothetical protein [uncultured Microbulbifer sp.]